jgi:hypothetical protein
MSRASLEIAAARSYTLGSSYKFLRFADPNACLWATHRETLANLLIWGSGQQIGLNGHKDSAILRLVAA